MKWILFRRESDNVHFFWNGEYIVCVRSWDGNAITDWTHLHAGIDIDIHHVVLRSAHSRTRILKFQGDKARYLIVEMGEFHKD